MTRAFRLRKDDAIGLALALLALAIYLVTLSPSIGYEDPGEIATAIRGLGIVHPTGYPLFSLLGRAFMLLPWGDLRVIARLNLLGALLCAAAVFVLYRLVLRFLRAADDARDTEPTALDRAAAAAGTLAFAFSRVFWANAVSVEVYALHLLLASVTTWLFARATDRPESTRTWRLFAYVLGLSFANHMMTVLLAPAFLALYFSRLGFGAKAWRRIAIAVPPFLLALSAYLYLPIRAAARPLMNWGDPSTLGAFWNHVTAEQYRRFMFSSDTVAADKAGAFFANLPADIGYLPVVLAVAGATLMAWRARGRLAFVALLFAACLLYAVNYNFEDDNFYLQAQLAVALCAAWGARGTAGFLARNGARIPGILAVAALGLFPLTLNYRAADRRSDYAIEDFTRNLLESVEPGSILLTDAYPVFAAPAFYLQTVEGIRPDVTVIQLNLFSVPWYRGYLAERNPHLIAGIEREILLHQDRMRRRELSREEINAGIRVIHQALIRNNRGLLPVHVTGDLEPEKSGGVFRGMTYRFYADSARPEPYGGPAPRFRPLKPGDPQSEYIRTYYAAVYANLGILRQRAGDAAGAIALLREAAALDSARPEIAARLRRLESSTPAPTR